MKQNKKRYNIFPNFNYLEPNIASPDQIKDWSEKFFYDQNLVKGEIRNYYIEDYIKNSKIMEGLFCTTIFGPTSNYRCFCGQYIKKKEIYYFNKTIYCEICKTELSHSFVRRYNFGYLNLIYPIVNAFFFSGEINYIYLLLKLKRPELTESDLNELIYQNSLINAYEEFFKEDTLENNNLEKELSYEHKFDLLASYYENFTFLKEDESYNNKEEELLNNFNKNSSLLDSFNKDNSSFLNIEIIKNELESLCINKEIKKLRSSFLNFEIEEKFLVLRLLENFVGTLTKPEWFIFTLLPILPPQLRPISKIEKKDDLSISLNELYLNISQYNTTLLDNLFHTSDFFFFYELKTLNKLQTSIDDLILYDRDEKKLSNYKVDQEKIVGGIINELKGKKGQYRSYMLGKRVDYSGRSVIVSGPTLSVNECGIPYFIAIKLFKFTLRKKWRKKIFITQKKKLFDLIEFLLKKKKLVIWQLLNQTIKKESIILNRAPTLHKGSLQSFNPILTLNLAIYLHPMVCSAFNADFDGDQLSINFSILNSSKIENLTLLKPNFNFLNISNGNTILKHNQEIILGCYYSTMLKYNILKTPLNFFSNFSDIISSFFLKKISLHQPIFINILINNLKFKYINFNFKKLLIDNKIFVKKFLFFKNKFILLTNIGFLICTLINKNLYKLKKFYLETTPGQIIYNNLINL